MALKSSFSSLLLLHTLLFILLPLLSHAHKLTNSSSSKVAFLEHLKGCHKGDTRRDIPKLKLYLENFGYLHYQNNSNHSINDDYFDPRLERALKTYQTNFHLNATGTMDSDTISTMMTPRCGVADIINGTNTMRKSHRHHQLRTVSHFSFFSGNPRWSKSRLTYAFLQGTPDIAMEPVSRAFQTWAANTQFEFERVSGGNGGADITVGFARGDHGDGFPFDGVGGPTRNSIAHAFAPENGRFHYDADERWGVRRPDALDLETVALHEIGHLLGLDHSEVEGAIMWPIIRRGAVKGLHQDDVQGIRVLYNV